MITWGDFILDDWLGPTLKSDPNSDGNARSVMEDRLARPIQEIGQKQPTLSPQRSDQDDRCHVVEVRKDQKMKSQESKDARSAFPFGFREEESG